MSYSVVLHANSHWERQSQSLQEIAPPSLQTGTNKLFIASLLSL